ncbi:putative kinesin [Trypanosoma rangeli]|uniref:Kinesin-like protein n=1 Tax=Trypanosoma rangeli TaxID=5698 RepID=A0A3S5IRH3_TRYRA|nr:putative kinesin [Trypanosoma rangeli]RNF06727.1 putative kinesin [Trypanosoma rangeli]|eukprot:RNF06727.1 putative kinesin [Trypanosoma rangeli]
MKSQSGAKTAPKNISVYLRVRPTIARESKASCNNLTFDPSDPRTVTVTRKSGSRDISKVYTFNKVFAPSTGQTEVYNEFARGAVDAAFDGQHGVLFVYGQTGSGKTYTISNNDPKNPGMLQQGLHDVWNRINNDMEYEYNCSVSYVQLYNEILTDLLDAQKGRVRIQLGSEGCGDVVLVAESSGLPIEKNVRNYEETMELFSIGMSRKEMTCTAMNESSSRSHTIFNFNITRSKKVKVVEVKTGELGDTPATALEGRLVICDLAGSERISKTHAEGKSLGEATHINGSLLVLGKVVAALTEKSSQHVPFRESKLTRILQYSLLGNGNTSIVVNCTPADDSSEETLSAILFGQRALQIKQEAKRHEVLDYKALYLQLMAELDSKNDGTLEDALGEERRVYEDRVNALEDRVKLLSTENDLLRQEIAALQSGGGEVSSTSCAAAGWQTVSKQMRDKLCERDAEIKTITDERFKLAILLAEEKRTAFRLAEKLRATLIRYQMDSRQWTQRQEELDVELARLKGTDYISVTGGMNECSSLCGTVGQASPTDSMNVSAGQGDAYLQEQLDKAYTRIRELNKERVERIVYQFKAEKAIRMLHAEKAALEKRLAQ